MASGQSQLPAAKEMMNKHMVMQGKMRNRSTSDLDRQQTPLVRVVEPGADDDSLLAQLTLRPIVKDVLLLVSLPEVGLQRLGYLCMCILVLKPQLDLDLGASQASELWLIPIARITIQHDFTDM